MRECKCEADRGLAGRDGLLLVRGRRLGLMFAVWPGVGRETIHTNPPHHESREIDRDAERIKYVRRGAKGRETGSESERGAKAREERERGCRSGRRRGENT
eukprot:265380-Chlamydomonas_euryale.AAC.1